MINSERYTTVVNIYKEPCDQYCGRVGKGQDGYFGNPFKNKSRLENIEDFKVYFYDRLNKDPEFKQKIHELKGKRLGCFCKPQACHADIIAEYLNSL
jgi:hypothetical protein